MKRRGKDRLTDRPQAHLAFTPWAGEYHIYELVLRYMVIGGYIEGSSDLDVVRAVRDRRVSDRVRVSGPSGSEATKLLSKYPDDASLYVRFGQRWWARADAISTFSACTFLASLSTSAVGGC